MKMVKERFGYIHMAGVSVGIIKDLDIRTESNNIKYQGSDAEEVQFIYFQVIKDKEKALRYINSKDI